MFDYIKGIIFICVFISFIYIFGLAICKDKYSEPRKFVTGYILYAAFVAIGGIPIQMLNLPWLLFFIYILLLIISICGFSIYRIKKYKIKLFADGLKEFFKSYWFLFFIAILMLAISTLQYDGQWLNNNMDDGYYLTKMAVLPYEANPFSTQYSTGLVTKITMFNAYNFNVPELESSVYLFIVRIVPTLFARGFMVLFYNFLFACVTYSFFEKVLSCTSIKIKKHNYQYVLIFLLILTLKDSFATNNNVFMLQDFWQTNTGMFYGSTFGRLMGIMMLLLPFINKTKFEIKDIFIYGITTFMILSKATSLLPVVLAVTIAYILVYLFEYSNKTRIGAGVLVVCLFVVGFILPNDAKINSYVFGHFMLNLTSIAMIVCIIITILFAFKKEKVVFEILGYIIIMHCMAFIEPLNNIFEKTSVYYFVGARFFTALYIFMIIFSCIELFMLVMPYIEKRHNCFGSAILTGCLACGIVYANAGSTKEVVHQLGVFWNNKYYAPTEILELGDKLKTIGNQPLYTLMPESVGEDGCPYALAISIRQFAPNVISLSAYERYPGHIDKKFSGYNAKVQITYHHFVDDPKNYFDEFKDIVDKYHVDCVVIFNANHTKYMKQLGYNHSYEMTSQNRIFIYHR